VEEEVEEEVLGMVQVEEVPVKAEVALEKVQVEEVPERAAAEVVEKAPGQVAEGPVLAPVREEANLVQLEEVVKRFPNMVSVSRVGLSRHSLRLAL